MFKYIRSFDEMKGLTIEKIVEDCEVAIEFTSGDRAIINSDSCIDFDAIPSPETKLKMGWITHDEYQEIFKLREAINESKRRESDLQHLVRLKAKYETEERCNERDD